MMDLRVADLAFGYLRQDGPVISGLTHTFHAGTTTAVTGPSGRGKSTLLYLLGLMLTPTGGSVWFGDDDVTHRDDVERSALRGDHVSMVFQDALLDPARTTLDNVLEGAVYSSRGHDVRRAHALLDRFGVGHRADHRPGEVSGGQAQRIALCRALLKKPSIILADEPTGNLDAMSASIVWDALVEAAHDLGTTVVIATHAADLLARSDHRIEL